MYLSERTAPVIPYNLAVAMELGRRLVRMGFDSKRQNKSTAFKVKERLDAGTKQVVL